MLYDRLEKADGTRDMINACLNIVNESNGVIAFGAGVGGVLLYNLLKVNGLAEKILCFSDNNELKFGKNYCGNQKTIVPPDELIKIYGNDTDIIICSSAFDIIKSQLIGYGFRAENVHLFNFAFMDLEYTDANFIFDNIVGFDRAYNRLEDDKSRNIFVDILNYKITKNSKYLELMQPFVDDEHYQYFDAELFGFIDQEIFLDLGAYTGDTLKTYMEVYKKWKGYIGFEADAVVFDKLKEFVKSEGIENDVRLYHCAAWDSKRKLFFDENPGSSKMGDYQDSGLSVTGISVDELLGENDVTFVKMDIEGAEYHALKGMRGLIRRNKPILAVCVYHLRDDFYKLTDLIEEILPNKYRYYFRQYRYTPTETVCYAIPEERINNSPGW